MFYTLNSNNYLTFQKNGYTIKNSSKDINWCIRCAYTDTARTAKGIQNYKQKIYNIMTDFIINKLPFSYSQCIFNKAFSYIAAQLTTQCQLHYGQAQKIINMSLKYLYNEIMLGNKMTFFDHCIKNTICDFFHMPIDSIILEKLKSVPISFEDKITKIKGTWKYQGYPWSQLPKKLYWDFVIDINKELMPGIKPLEAEYHTWKNPNPQTLKRYIYK